jgi:hypothetical protein
MAELIGGRRGAWYGVVVVSRSEPRERWSCCRWLSSACGGGCGRNERNAVIIKKAVGGRVWCGRGSNAELANNDEEEVVGVCYGGICTVWCGGESG